jgi:predicted nuclease with RNAse H fold
VLRPPSQAALERLTQSAKATDRDLDRALSDVGVLPPLDLTQIRQLLTRNGTNLALDLNDDGHTIIEVVTGGRAVAWVQHDGRVDLSNAVAV